MEQLSGAAPRRYTGDTAVNTDQTREFRVLLWIYVVLLVFEGALRKWILPQYSNALYLVRDPVVLYMYYRALRKGLFPVNNYIVCGFVLAGVMLATSLAADHGSLTITLYGVRCAVFYLPFIFLIPRICTVRDVEKIGTFMLVVSIPLVVLIVIQHYSPIKSFWNLAVGGKGYQIPALYGKGRTSATFSFVTGVGEFYSFVTAFLIYSFLRKRRYPPWLMVGAYVAVMLSLIHI